MKKIGIVFLLGIYSLFIFTTGCKKEEKKIDNNQETIIDDKNNDEEKIGDLYFHYYFNNGEPDLTVKVDDPKNYKLLDVTRDGYQFLNYYFYNDANQRIDYDNITKPTGSNDIIIKLDAQWKAIKYKVEFYCQGSRVSLKSVEYGTNVKAPNPTIIPGYKFIEWDNDYSFITKDTIVNAIYEEIVNPSKNILVVLGNWMNDDGTMSATMKKRLALCLEAYDKFNPDYIVVTGGMANAKAGISEAQAMYSYLTTMGINPGMIIKEDQSLSTNQNAIYTMTKLENFDFDNLIIVSTIEHFVNYQTVKYFNDAALANQKIKEKNINIMIYTNNANS